MRGVLKGDVRIIGDQRSGNRIAPVLFKAGPLVELPNCYKRHGNIDSFFSSSRQESLPSVNT